MKGVRLSYKRWFIVALAIVIVSLGITYYYYYEPIPTTCSLPDVDELVLFSGIRQTAPFTPTRGLFLVDANTGKTWQLTCLDVPSLDVDWVPQLQMFSIHAEGQLITYSLSSSGTFSQNQSLKGASGRHSWAPDGKQVVYSKIFVEFSSRQNDGLYIRASDGLSEQYLTFMLSDAGRPNWSPTSEKIIFESYNRDTRQFSLYKINSDGTGLIPLTEQVGGSNRTAKWSPDGTKIAFLHAQSTDQAYQLWVMNADGTEIKSIVMLPIEDDSYAGGVRDFAWSPDSSSLVFASGHEGPCNTYSFLVLNTTTTCRTRIYRINVDGTDLVRLTRGHQGRYFDFVWIR